MDRQGERGRGRGGPHGTIKAPSCAVVCWPPILLLTYDYSKNPRLRNWLLRTCSTKICQLGTDQGGRGGGCWKMLKKILCRGCKYQTLIIYTKKLLNSDWLRKECSSFVTRVQTCNTNAKLVTTSANYEWFLIGWKHKRNQQEPIRLELFYQQNSRKWPWFSVDDDGIKFCKQNNNRKKYSKSLNTVKSTSFWLNVLKMRC